ncbi:peptidase M16 [Chitinophagaceae bacterium IBVUCB1]|nr:peptidase M16 [Chitinophagaceae bacterium IBVUCB1]
MKRILLSLCAISILGIQQAAAQAKLVETVAKKGSEVVIPYKKFVLPNGLTLIVHEDHSDPIVHVDVTYHVGSAREEIGKSGFAHFFEHMMFQGSDNVADEQHFKIITEAGGTLNGTTNRDRTNYFETVPSNQLEKMLWLEADRMGFLLDAVTQKKFEVQRATVKNERGQNYDNRPYGLVGEFSSKNLYPYGHPYSWLTIGYIEDLNAVNVNDLKNFFLRWYGPNNAVVTVGGDVNTEDVVKMVEKYFGSIPRGPEVKPVTVPAVKLEKKRYVSMMDNYAKSPMLRISYPTVASYNKDEAALDCLAEIIGQGKNSLLYKNMIKTQKAVSASAFNSTSELAGEFSFSVMPFPGAQLADMEKLVNESLAEFEKRGVTDEDIEKFRNSAEASTINGLENVSRKVSQLAAYYTFTGDANYVGKELKRYTSVTKEDVMRVYNQYIKGKNSLVVSVLTKGQETNKAAADNYEAKTDPNYKSPDYGYAGLKYNKAKDNFDRSKMPANGPSPVVKAPDYWEEKLSANMKVIGAKSDEIPVVSLLMHFDGGRMLEMKNPDKAGLTAMFAAMMNEDTKNYTAEAFSVALDKLGSSIDVNADFDGISVSVRSLKKNLDKTLALLEERLLNPKFTEDAFNTNKKRTIEGIKNAMVRPNYIASVVYDKILYGDNHVLGWASEGNEATLNNIKLSDMQEYYDAYMSRNGAEVIVVGDINKDEVLSKISFINKMKDTEIPMVQLPAAPVTEKTKIYFVDVPKAAQTEFRIGVVTGLHYDAFDTYYKSTIMNYPLGGAFNSRLNLDLREERGWTYGARSSFSGDKYTGTYTFSAGIRANATDSALMDIVKIWNDYRKSGMTQEELNFTKNALVQSEARKYETALQKASFLSRIIEYSLPADYTKRQNDILTGMTVEQLAKFQRSTLPSMDKVNIVLVGDKAKVWDGINKLGYEVIELNKEGNPIK